MVFKKRIDINPSLPTSDDPSAGQHVILGTAELEVHLSTHPGASKPFVVVFLYHPVLLAKSGALAELSGSCLRARQSGIAH
jgi:hypothetical protein